MASLSEEEQTRFLFVHRAKKIVIYVYKDRLEASWFTETKQFLMPMQHRLEKRFDHIEDFFSLTMHGLQKLILEFIEELK
jgi:hypothetical protein